MSSEKNQVTLLCMYHFALYLRHYKNQISWYLRLQSPCLNFLDTLMGLGVRFFSSTYFGQFPKQANLLIWLCWYIQLCTFGPIFSVCGRIFQEEEEPDGFYQSLGNLESKSKEIERENFGSWKRRGTFLILLKNVINTINNIFVNVMFRKFVPPLVMSSIFVKEIFGIFP